jgi:hypothetical protein
MSPIELALARIQKDPDHSSSKVLCSLLIALDSGEGFSFRQFNALDYNDFVLAMEALRDWRLEERRVKQGELSAAAAIPESCCSVWRQLREDAYAARIA